MYAIRSYYEFKLTDVKTIDFSGDVKIVETFRNRYEAKAVIIRNNFV